jgi:hypothetical protein
MRSSRLLLVALTCSGVAAAQTPAPGFALERGRGSAPGAGWFMNDTLALDGALGGAVSLSLGYAHQPLVVQGDAGPLSVVTHQTEASIAAAVSWQRFRFSVDFVSPVYTSGQSGVAQGLAYIGPHANLEQDPDTLGDVRLGLEARLWGAANGPFRLGAGVQLFVPSGGQADYLSDGTWRAAVRLLAAGDLGRWSWAVNLGAHYRPLREPGSAQGSEALFGLAFGARLPTWSPDWQLQVGPELSGATAFATGTTGLEALLGVRLESLEAGEVRWRFRLAGGAGLATALGMPGWQVLLGLEVGGHTGP